MRDPAGRAELAWRRCENAAEADQELIDIRRKLAVAPRGNTAKVLLEWGHWVNETVAEEGEERWKKGQG